MKRHLIPVILALVSFSCGKTEIDSPGGGSGSQEFTLLLPGVKTSLSGQNAFWSKGDKVVFYGGGQSSSAVFVSKNTTASSRASFTCLEGKALKCGNYYNCITPVSSFRKWGDDGILEMEIPSIQTVESAGWDSEAAVFAGSGAGTSFSMVSACAFIRFTINAESVKAGKVFVSGSAPKGGPASVEFSKGTCSFRGPVSGSVNTVTLQAADKVFKAGTYYIAVFPGSTAEDIDISFADASGKVLFKKSLSGVQLSQGRSVNLGTIPAAEESGCKLIASGQNKVYLIDAGKLKWEDEYNKGLIWSWTSSSLGKDYASADISEAIPVNNGRELLVTGAYYNSKQKGWCAHLRPDYSTPDGVTQLFFTAQTQNAHSAAVLPGGYIVVACSTGDDCLKVFQPSGLTPDTPIGSYPLTSAHGVVWNENSKRLFAIGGVSLNIYSFNEADGSLELKKSVSTASYTDHIHALTEVDANTLAMGGNYVATYDIPTGTFKSVTWFMDAYTKGIKSLNFNPMTGEAIYTFASSVAGVEGNDTHTHTIRYTEDVRKQYDHDAEKHIMVNNINMYKVRVLSW